jgi:hypothetical protein
MREREKKKKKKKERQNRIVARTYWERDSWYRSRASRSPLQETKRPQRWNENVMFLVCSTAFRGSVEEGKAK